MKEYTYWSVTMRTWKEVSAEYVEVTEKGVVRFMVDNCVVAAEPPHNWCNLRLKGVV